jgi:serine/threonine-protein phosphatase Stp1
MAQHFRFKSAGLTHEGLVRERNEDAHLVRDGAGLWIVADGMGGHDNGQWAAETVVAAVAKAPLTGKLDADIAAVEAAIADANAVILEKATAAGRTMGSTVVALVIQEGRFACLWCGDSRIYRLAGGRLSQVTRDHTQIQDMLERGVLTTKEAEGHPLTHVLSHAIGVETPIRLDRVVGEVGERDAFLLCSDGLTDVVSDAEISTELAGLAPGRAGRRLMDLVMERGAPDNVTLVAVVCEEMTAVTFSGGT